MVEKAMQVMDEGYLEGDRRETFTYDDYAWTEHISRKLGHWNGDPKELLEPLAKCGFRITRKRR